VDEGMTVDVVAMVLGVETAPPSCGLITFVEVVTPSVKVPDVGSVSSTLQAANRTQIATATFTLRWMTLICMT
jgi:hypothetical protein